MCPSQSNVILGASHLTSIDFGQGRLESLEAVELPHA